MVHLHTWTDIYHLTTTLTHCSSSQKNNKDVKTTAPRTTKHIHVRPPPSFPHPAYSRPPTHPPRHKHTSYRGAHGRQLLLDGFNVTGGVEGLWGWPVTCIHTTTVQWQAPPRWNGEQQEASPCWKRDANFAACKAKPRNWRQGT